MLERRVLNVEASPEKCILTLNFSLEVLTWTRVAKDGVNIELLTFTCCYSPCDAASLHWNVSFWEKMLFSYFWSCFLITTLEVPFRHWHQINPNAWMHDLQLYILTVRYSHGWPELLLPREKVMTLNLEVIKATLEYIVVQTRRCLYLEQFLSRIASKMKADLWFVSALQGHLDFLLWNHDFV